jgi:FMN phosphatase YigB (HAD superfamily)
LTDGLPRGVTFDWWGTLFLPRPNRDARSTWLHGWLAAERLVRHPDHVRDRFDAAVDRQQKAWREGRHVGSRAVLVEVLDDLDVRLPESALAGALLGIEDVRGASLPPLAAGVRELVERLHSLGVRLGIVSDTGLSTGRVLRRLLEEEGLARYFDPAALAFSDEVGVPKPNAPIFHASLAGLGLAPAEVVHIGDLRATDVTGGRRLGMRTVRYRGHFDDVSDLPDADVVVSDHADVLEALGRPDGRGPGPA